MKTPYYFLLAVMLMVFTGCKKEEPNARQRNLTTQATEAVCTPHTSFDLTPGKSSLKLINNDTEIQADFILMTEDEAFEYANEYKIIESGNYKGVVFMYKNRNDADNPDDEEEDSPINIRFKFIKPTGWAENQEVRIIAFNEKNVTDFAGLEDFFKLKLSTFKDQFACTEHNEALVEMWNHYNPGNTVNIKKNLGLKRPRITKDDGVLSIKR